MVKKNKKKETRRPSVRDRARTTKDVAYWVDTTQPSRKKEEAAPVKERATTYVSEESLETQKSEELVEEPKRLDGGYAWVIVAFSFLLHFIADGLTFSFGQMFHAILLKFNVNRLAGGFIGACFLSLPLACSPFASVIGDHLGCRLELIGGLSLSIVGIVIALGALLLENFVLFFIGFSLFLSLGLALVYNGAIVIVNLYFEKRLGFATSLAVSGTGVGTMLFPQIIGKFEFWFPGESATATCLFALVLCVGAMLFCVFAVQDVEWTSDSVEYKRRMFEKHVRKLDKERRNEENDCYEPEEEGPILRRCLSLPCVAIIKEVRGSMIDLGISMQSIRESVSMSKQVEPPVPRSRSVGTFMRKTLPTVPEYTMLNADDFGHLDHLDLHMGYSPANTIHSKQPSRVRMLSKTSMSVDAINDMDDEEISNTRLCFSDSEDEVENEEESETESDSERSNDGMSSESELSDRVLTKKNGAANGVAKTNGTANGVTINVPQVKPESARPTRPSVAVGHQAPGRILVGRTGYRVRTNTNLLASQTKMPSAPLIYHRKRKWHEKHETLGQLWNALCSLPRQFPLYGKILKEDRTCCMFIISVCCLYMVLDVPYVFFFDHAVENLDMPGSDASTLTTTLGFASLVSTWVIGWLADLPFFQDKLFLFNGISMFLVGAAVFFASVATSFWGMMGSCMILGSFVSSNYVLQSVLLMQLFPDTNKFMISYAMICMFEGGATFIGPPIIGLVRDFTGNYFYVFLVSGLILFVSAFLSFYTDYLLRTKKRNSRSPSRESKDIPLIECA